MMYVCELIDGDSYINMLRRTGLHAESHGIVANVGLFLKRREVRTDVCPHISELLGSQHWHGIPLQ